MKAFSRHVLTQDSRSLSPAEKPVYPFWTPQQVRTSPITYTPKPTYTPLSASPNPRTPLKRRSQEVNQLQSELKDLESEVTTNRRLRDNRRLVTQLNTLSSLLTPSKPIPAPSPPPQVNQFLQHLQHQQDAFFTLLRDTTSPAIAPSPPSAFPPSTYSPYAPKPISRAPTPKPPALHPIEEQYIRLRDRPGEFKRMWNEVGLGLDSSLILENGPYLTQDEKKRILARMKVKLYQRLKHVKTKIGKLRVIGWVVLFPIFAYSSALRRKRKEKISNLRNMEESIHIFREVAKQWVLRAIRVPLYSIVADPDLDLNIVSRAMAPKGEGIEELRPTAKAMKLQVRVKGMIQGLREMTSIQEMPGPLRTFIDQLISEGAFIPPSYLLGFESSRLDKDGFGSLRDQTPLKQEMLVSFFFITRILVKDILLSADGGGTYQNPTPKTTT